jgi:hypothetical protein
VLKTYYRNKKRQQKKIIQVTSLFVISGVVLGLIFGFTAISFKPLSPVQMKPVAVIAKEKIPIKEELKPPSIHPISVYENTRLIREPKGELISLSNNAEATNVTWKRLIEFYIK